MICSRHKIQNPKNKIPEKGAAVLIVNLTLLLVAVIFIPAFVFLIRGRQETLQNQLKVSLAYYTAEAAIEDAIYRIKKGMKYSESNNLTVEGATATSFISGSGSSKIITVESQLAGRHRKVEAVMATEGVLADFHYGVQVGRGGLEMGNTSKVIGSVYSNGNIVGDNSPEITGDAFAAASSSISNMKIGGDSWAYRIDAASEVGSNATTVDLLDNTNVTGNAYAGRITRSNIGGNATYVSIDDATTVGGQKIATTTAPEALPEQPFPISDSQLDEWENQALNGGPPINSPCPYVISSGTVNLGPVKINCDLTVRLNATLVVNGPIWVKGNITVQNNGIIKLAGYFGGNSSVIIADDPDDRQNKGIIRIKNSAQFVGSGASGSYLLAVSRNNSAAGGGAVTAIDVNNSSVSSIFYAPYGLIKVQNNINLKEATAYKLKIANQATITYESGLSNLLFTSGPTAGWTLIDWQEKL